MFSNVSIVLTPVIVAVACVTHSASSRAETPPAVPSQPTNTWIKRSPLPDAPVSPRLGYEGACVWDSRHQLLVRYGGHNQGGGGEQGAEVWTFDLDTARWTLKTPNTSPPGVCCNKQNVYDPTIGRYIRFPRFSGSHGWQWWREIYLNDSSVWTYDVVRNRWRDMKPPAMPPTDKNDPELTYDPINKVVLALVKVTTNEGDQARHDVQTWSYDAGVNKWTRMKPDAEPDAAGNRTRNLVFAPERNLAILENCTGKPREQQVWAYRYANTKAEYKAPKAKPRTSPPIVEDVVVSVLNNKRVEVDWKPPVHAKIAGYLVERAVVEVWTDDQLVRLKRNTPPLASPVVGAIQRIGTFRQLTTRPIVGISFVDDGVDLGKPEAMEGKPIYESNLHAEHLDRSGRGYRHAVFAYRIRAVDDAGKVSGPSPAAFTIPSTPQQVFSREDGTTCLLKWVANPEKGIAGYRVYRMDGRWSKDPVSRLFIDPQADTTFSDITAGKHSRRYYVVAVDALGQEGFPSAPVWFQREWRAYYAPFVDKWHQ